MPGDTAAHRRGLVIKDRYELDRMPLAHGGMGEVWTGRDTLLDREIAVKFIRFPGGVRDDELVRRFVRESRITARLVHPGVPAVYDVGTHDDRPYLVMELINGISVADLLAEHGPLPVGWAAAIAAQTCAVLAVAHQASLVHRDLKPGNLMLDRDGGVKVLDFGLAVALDLTEVSQITRSGQTLGTLAYMAPEQILSSTSSPRSDLYGLGCTLYEMLTGEAVFTGPTAYAVMRGQVDAPPRPPRLLRPELPADLDRLVLHLLAKNPEDRPAGAAAVYHRLAPLATGLSPLPGVLRPAQQPSPVRMYATVLGRIFPDGSATPTPAGPGGVGAGAARTGPDTSARSEVDRGPSRAHGAPDGAPGMDRGELDLVRAEAADLARRSRYGQAAAMLAAAVPAATRTLGPADPEVLSLRLHLADVQFDGGDHRAAGPAYHRLVADLGRARDADVDLVLRCRLREATCHALGGQTSRALRQMQDLLRDQTRIKGADDPGTLELRRQIGLLQLGAGQTGAALYTLRSLESDLVRVHGAAHPAVAGVRDALSGLTGRP